MKFELEVVLIVRHRATLVEPIEARHAALLTGMADLKPPFGLAQLSLPPVPPVKFNNLSTIINFSYPLKGLRLSAKYMLRHESCLDRDTMHLDDRLIIEFRRDYKNVDYRQTLREEFPKMVEAFDAYRASAKFGVYGGTYSDSGWNEWAERETTNPDYWKLRADPSIDIDGRNNIYTLEPAVFWDDLLCRRALGYGADEALRRLQGQAPLVMPLHGGVYAVFNDDPDLSYDAFVEMNRHFKGLLGLE